MRTVVIAVICLFLGLATGYVITNLAGGELTPAELEEGLRKNPRMVMDLLHQYPEEILEIVLDGQDIKREEERVAKIDKQLREPLTVTIPANRAVLGPKDAPLTIVEFSDFQCPHCAKASTTVKQLMERYPDELNLVFMHMPLSSHKMAPLAAAYFEAAARQDLEKAWKLHDVLFANQKALEEGGQVWLQQQAAELGLDTEAIEEMLRGEELKNLLRNDLMTAKALNLRGAPSFLVGGVLISGAAPMQEFVEVIDKVKAYRALNPDARKGGAVFVGKDAAEEPAQAEAAPEAQAETAPAEAQ